MHSNGVTLDTGTHRNVVAGTCKSQEESEGPLVDWSGESSSDERVGVSSLNRRCLRGGLSDKKRRDPRKGRLGGGGVILAGAQTPTCSAAPANVWKER